MKDNYRHISAEEIAQDDDFILLVRNNDASQQMLLDQWLLDYPEQQEKLGTARALVEAIAWSVPQLGQDRKASLWEAIEAGTEEGAKIKSLPRRNRWWIGAAAAVALLLLAGWWFSNNDLSGEMQLIAAAPTETITHLLPDESVVSLNAVSELSYVEDNWSKERSLQLKGEAFFEVQKGKKFQVNTTLGTVEVLGTSFNVEERNGRLRVQCYTGKVRVSVNTGESIILNPQEAIDWTGGALRKYPTTNEQAIAWRQQLHHFDGVPLSEVFAELERQYNITVNYSPEIGKRIYEGFFKSGDLEEALTSICWPMKLTYKIQEGSKVVVITTDE